MKTPTEIAADTITAYPLREFDTPGFYGMALVAAIEADRAQRDEIPFGQARFTVEFDNLVWESLADDEREAWLNEAIDALNAVAYVSHWEWSQ